MYEFLIGVGRSNTYDIRLKIDGAGAEDSNIGAGIASVDISGSHPFAPYTMTFQRDEFDLFEIIVGGITVYSATQTADFKGIGMRGSTSNGGSASLNVDWSPIIFTGG